MRTASLDQILGHARAAMRAATPFVRREIAPKLTVDIGAVPTSLFIALPPSSSSFMFTVVNSSVAEPNVSVAEARPRRDTQQQMDILRPRMK
jgi:hypothetical protein